MSKWLLKTVETYRVDTENEVENLIQEAKEGMEYSLAGYTSKYKEKKEDAYWVVTLTKTMTSEKEPSTQIEVEYKGGAF